MRPFGCGRRKSWRRRVEESWPIWTKCPPFRWQRLSKKGTSCIYKSFVGHTHARLKNATPCCCPTKSSREKRKPKKRSMLKEIATIMQNLSYMAIVYKRSAKFLANFFGGGLTQAAELRSHIKPLLKYFPWMYSCKSGHQFLSLLPMLPYYWVEFITYSLSQQILLWWQLRAPSRKFNLIRFWY